MFFPSAVAYSGLDSQFAAQLRRCNTWLACLDLRISYFVVFDKVIKDSV
jgi:hypothetical protein